MLRKKLVVAMAAATAFVATVGASAASANVQPGIVGGDEATAATPWMTSVQYDAPDYGRVDYHTCGGSLVFRGWVVTNAHCVTDPPAGLAASPSSHALFAAPGPIPTAAKRFHVRVGSHDRTQGGETARVVEIVVHPGWNWGMGDPGAVVDDIALLKLDHDVNAQPVRLAGHAAAPGTRVTLYGWGMDSPDGRGTLPTRLQELRTSVVQAAGCADAGISAAEICTANPHGTDGPGAGDSGGPAVQFVRGVPQLVGSCSRAASPYPGVAPTVYTSEPDFRRFIYDTARGVPTAP